MMKPRREFARRTSVRNRSSAIQSALDQVPFPLHSHRLAICTGTTFHNRPKSQYLAGLFAQLFKLPIRGLQCPTIFSLAGRFSGKFAQAVGAALGLKR